MINSFLFYEMTYITNSYCGRIAGNNISGMNIYKVSSAVFIIINIAMKYFKRVIVFVHFSVSFYLILILSAKKKKYVIIRDWGGLEGNDSCFSTKNLF